MMLIVMHKYPLRAAKLLIKNTSDQFCFKQLIELGQLICSAGISNVYKKVPQGKEIQEWIRRNPEWTYLYMTYLSNFCYSTGIKVSLETNRKLYTIMGNLITFWANTSSEPSMSTNKCCKTAIWRYKKSYVSGYPTNSELPVEIAAKLYTDYITKFKFPRKMTDIYK